jgi:hypothetical protein
MGAPVVELEEVSSPVVVVDVEVAVTSVAVASVVLVPAVVSPLVVLLLSPPLPLVVLVAVAVALALAVIVSPVELLSSPQPTAQRGRTRAASVAARGRACGTSCRRLVRELQKKSIIVSAPISHLHDRRDRRGSVARRP